MQNHGVLLGTVSQDSSSAAIASASTSYSPSSVGTASAVITGSGSAEDSATGTTVIEQILQQSGVSVSTTHMSPLSRLDIIAAAKEVSQDE